MDFLIYSLIRGLIIILKKAISVAPYSHIYQGKDCPVFLFIIFSDPVYFVRIQIWPWEPLIWNQILSRARNYPSFRKELKNNWFKQ
jgi:hypothetical protein